MRYICVSLLTSNGFGIASSDSPKFCLKSISIPLAMAEIGTSFADPSNGFSPTLPIRFIVWNTHITTIEKGTANQTIQLKSAFIFSLNFTAISPNWEAIAKGKIAKNIQVK